MSTGFLSRLFTRIFAGSLVREAYAGILGREPDAVGMKAHVIRLRRTGLLAPVLQEMAFSDEAQRTALPRAADGLVAKLLAALADGDVGQDQVAEWKTQLRRNADLQSVVEAMCRHPSHWRRLVRQDADVLISAAFVAFLRRQPLRNELLDIKAQFAIEPDLRRWLTELGESAEYRAAVTATSVAQTDHHEASVHPTLAPNASTAVIDHEAIVAATFKALLGREPDPVARSAYLARLDETGDVAEFIAEVGRSTEHRKYVLLRRS